MKVFIAAIVAKCSHDIFLDDGFSKVKNSFPKLITTLGTLRIEIPDIRKIMKSLFTNEAESFLWMRIEVFYKNEKIAEIKTLISLETPYIDIESWKEYNDVVFKRCKEKSSREIDFLHSKYVRHHSPHL